MSDADYDRAVHLRPKRAASEANSPRTTPDRAQALLDALRRADRCSVCGAALEDPESRKIGVGPTCRDKQEQAS